MRGVAQVHPSLTGKNFNIAPTNYGEKQTRSSKYSASCSEFRSCRVLGNRHPCPRMRVGVMVAGSQKNATREELVISIEQSPVNEAENSI
jgi:hypothetical protein